MRSGGPGRHPLVLMASRDFWDDRSRELVEPAQLEIEAESSALAGALSERWGEPESVGLRPYLERDEGVDAAPEPVRRLSNLAGSMQVWRAPGASRRLGLAVGQADPQFPVRLLAAVGETATLPG
ncbi:hypothetical protein [Streptomyces sp. ALB3]|uniref:hypothetical protein n=1 Tax=Streptomyces sp. ALB3 TaxID=3374278 RepID=UPI0037A07AD6